MFIWKILNCFNGDIDKIIEMAIKADYSHVLIKIANGVYSYNYDWDKSIDLVPPLVQACRWICIECRRFLQGKIRSSKNLYEYIKIRD